jgi:hypothetical protein
MKFPRYFLFLAVLAISGCAPANAVKSTATAHHQHQDQHHGGNDHHEKAIACTSPSPTTQCSNTVTAEFTPSGTLWIAWVNDEHIYVQSSTDKGQNFSAPVMVNAKPEKIAAKGENRPKLKFDNNGNMYVTWAWSLGKRHAGHIRFARSSDGGQSFSEPVTVNDNLDVIGHSFDSMAIGQNGEIFIAWLDSRDTEAAKKAGQKFDGSSLYYTWSKDGGKTFQPNKRIAAHVCQCCRLQTAIAKDNTPVILWRHIFDGSIRDHALVKFIDWQTPGDMQRVGQENWKIDACPHHGAGLAISDNDTYHAVWFSNADVKKGLFYAHSTDAGKHFSEPMNFGGDGAAHPYIQTLGQQVAIVWQEFDGKNNTLQLIKSGDAGKTWSKPEAIAKTPEGVDTPFLVTDGKVIYVSWQVQKQDYHLQKINF